VTRNAKEASGASGCSSLSTSRHSLATIRQSGSRLVIRPLFNSQPHFTRRRLCGSLVFLTPYLTSLVDD
jgi:hypothetical protein